MARRKLSMNEYLEMVYQWHRGRSVRQIRDSLRMSRKTIHKYLRRLAEEGLSRERPLPEEAELAQRVASVVNSAVFEQPARERIPAKVAGDIAYRNARKNSDKQNARIEHDQALKRVMTTVLNDDMQLFKQFTDNEGFQRWLTDTVFGLTYAQPQVGDQATVRD